MGAGQIGGIATLLDIDFDNPAHFLGERAEPTDGQFIVSYLSHAMLFCVGALIEAHVVLTPASCVFGEKYKFDVFGGTHKFIENVGVSRKVHHFCMHRGYNHSSRLSKCSPDNIALLVLNQQFSFNKREPGSEFIINRVRYGLPGQTETRQRKPCVFYGWGSRRNGYLIPLLIHLRRVEIEVLPSKYCADMWNNKNKYLCLNQPPCRDDIGTLLICDGFAHGMMTSRLIDRPCGVGFIDLTLYNKFLTCGVDDSRDVIDHEDTSAFEAPLKNTTPTLMTPSTTPSDDEPRAETPEKTKKSKDNSGGVGAAGDSGDGGGGRAGDDGVERYGGGDYAIEG